MPLLYPWPNAGNAAALIAANPRRKVICRYCGLHAGLLNRPIHGHERICERNPNRKEPSKTVNKPCTCGRRDKFGRPYLQDHQGGPCFRCWREQLPNPDLDQLDWMISQRISTPRAEWEAQGR